MRKTTTLQVSKQHDGVINCGTPSQEPLRLPQKTFPELLEKLRQEAYLSPKLDSTKLQQIYKAAFVDHKPAKQIYSEIKAYKRDIKGAIAYMITAIKDGKPLDFLEE